MAYKVLVPVKRCKGEIRENIIGYVAKGKKLIGKIISDAESWIDEVVSEEKISSSQKGIIVSKCKVVSQQRRGKIILNETSNRRFYE